jgi:hypothetical protein
VAIVPYCAKIGRNFLIAKWPPCYTMYCKVKHTYSLLLITSVLFQIVTNVTKYGNFVTLLLDHILFYHFELLALRSRRQIVLQPNWFGHNHIVRLAFNSEYFSQSTTCYTSKILFLDQIFFTASWDHKNTKVEKKMKKIAQQNFARARPQIL